MLLYGSLARGDADERSDIDILQLVDHPVDHYSDGNLSVAAYSVRQLEVLCSGGSLFALHLVTEGLILDDPTGVLSRTLKSYQPPPSYQPLWAELRLAAQVLDVDEAVFSRNPVGFVRFALYVTRTTSILRHLEASGKACFSIAGLAAALCEPDLVQVFQGREIATTLGRDRFESAKAVLGRLIAEPIRNDFGSLEALAVNVEPGHPMVSRIVVRLLSGEETLGYGDLFLDPLMSANV